MANKKLQVGGMRLIGVENDTDLRFVSWRHEAVQSRAVEYGMRPGSFIVYFNAKRTLCRILLNLNGIRGVLCCEKDEGRGDTSIFDSIVATLAAHAPFRFKGSLRDAAGKIEEFAGE